MEAVGAAVGWAVAVGELETGDSALGPADGDGADVGSLLLLGSIRTSPLLGSAAGVAVPGSAAELAPLPAIAISVYANPLAKSITTVPAAIHGAADRLGAAAAGMGLESRATFAWVNVPGPLPDIGGGSTAVAGNGTVAIPDMAGDAPEDPTAGFGALTATGSAWMSDADTPSDT